MSIIGTVANALQLIETKGFAVLRHTEDEDIDDVHYYVDNVLHGIKASYSTKKFGINYLILLDDGRDSIYEELDAAIKAANGKPLFKAIDGTDIVDPYLDETGRYGMDPLNYYGIERIMKAIGR